MTHHAPQPGVENCRQINKAGGGFRWFCALGGANNLIKALVCEGVCFRPAENVPSIKFRHLSAAALCRLFPDVGYGPGPRQRDG
jgi:hypothetical protein